MDIGFVGLGLMGRPMAQHLARAGHQLHLWARRPASLEPFADSGAIVYASAAQMAAAAEVVITMVADAPDVEAVLFAADGIAAGARPGTAIIDMSTIAPAAAQAVGRQLGERGLGFLDAPVSGGEVGAINATLTIMVGGDPELFDRLHPLFDCLGKSVTRIGTIGAGQVAKACNQILTGVTVAAVAEALHFARSAGVDAAKVREALLGGFAYSRVLENHGQRMLDGKFAPGFKAWMHRKDLRIVLEEAHRLGLMLPNAAATAQMFNAVVGCGLGEEDSIAVLKVLEGLSRP